MSLKEWLRNGWITEHTTSQQELIDLFGVIDRDLEACETPGLVSDWRFTIAYNAALQLAKAALAAAGYEASRIAHHYRLIQTLRFTIKAKASLIDEFDQARKKRNLADYERAGLISELEAETMIAFTQNLRLQVERWLKQHHPSLFSG